MLEARLRLCSHLDRPEARHAAVQARASPLTRLRTSTGLQPWLEGPRPGLTWRQLEADRQRGGVDHPYVPQAQRPPGTDQNQRQLLVCKKQARAGGWVGPRAAPAGPPNTSCDHKCCMNTVLLRLVRRAWPLPIRE